MTMDTADRKAFDAGVKWGREMYQREAKNEILEACAVLCETNGVYSTAGIYYAKCIRALKNAPTPQGGITK